MTLALLAAVHALFVLRIPPYAAENIRGTALTKIPVKS